MSDRFYERAKELVSQMTLEEKCSQLKYDSPAIDRLGIPAYNWWNEGLHGVARAGTATVFPQAIALAAAFDDELVKEIAGAVSDEARAKYNYASQYGDRDIYKGLTLWAPNVNIFRDPRWGRGHETYGEDPYLAAAMGTAFVKGLQGDGEYLKAAACAKHFAVHSGPEALRHEFDAQVSEKDMAQTYLYAFEKLVKAGAEGVMGAYNSVNGEPCCANSYLMNKLGEWGFDGYFVSDCWAIKDFHEGHGFTVNAVESAAAALKAGCDINCGNTYIHLMNAYAQGILDESDIDRAAAAALRTRLRLGLFDKTPYDDIPYETIGSPEHERLSLKAAERSVVLLHNDGILPLDKDMTASIAVIGPNADSRGALVGNYYGTSPQYVTFLDGIRESFGGRVYYSVGCELSGKKTEVLALPYDRISEAVAAAMNADVTVLCLGLDETLEGEEGDDGNAYASGDKPDLLLPEPQRFLLDTILKLGRPTVVVTASGSSLNIFDGLSDGLRPDAWVQAFYPGAMGGRALTEILFGEVSPSGKLPVTFYETAELLPDITDYSMKNRTYRGTAENILYPFGFGLTYGRTAISHAEYDREKNCVILTAENKSEFDFEEVFQVYVRSDSEFSPEYPSLCGFRRYRLSALSDAEITIRLSEDVFSDVDNEGVRYVSGRKFSLWCGVSQPDERSVRLCGVKPVRIDLSID